MISMRIVTAFLFSLVLLFDNNTSWASNFEEQFLECSKHAEADQRLACYDALAEKQQLANKLEFIQPDRKFLDSRLALTPGDSGYRLLISDFVKLIASAVLDTGKKIAVHGWTRQDQEYVLHITMRGPTQLRFLPIASTTGEIPISILRSPEIDGQFIDPELFVITIAAMTPDDENSAQ